ncbi:MAG: hypothetical protein ABIB43_06005 [archaeon]
MKEITKGIITVVLSLAMGYEVGRVLTEKKMEDKIAEGIETYFEKEDKKTEIATFGGTITTLQEIESKEEKKALEKTKKDSIDTYLASKAGFEFTPPDTKIRMDKIAPNLPDIGLFYRTTGLEMTYNITNYYGDPQENLWMQGYDKETYASSKAYMGDKTHNGTIDFLLLTDDNNNQYIAMHLFKDGWGFTGIDEESGMKFIEEFNQIYKDFKEKYEIDERVALYERKLELEFKEAENPGVYGYQEPTSHD